MQPRTQPAPASCARCCRPATRSTANGTRWSPASPAAAPRARDARPPSTPPRRRGSGTAPGRSRSSTACRRVEGAQPPARGQPAQTQRPPAPVSVTTAVQRDVPVYLDQIGKNVAPEVVTIQPQVSGRITGIHVKDGATVKRGELLFTIDPRPYPAQLDSAE